MSSGQLDKSKYSKAAKKIAGCYFLAFQAFSKCMGNVPEAPEGMSVRPDSTNPMFLKLREKIANGIRNSSTDVQLDAFSDSSDLDDFN